MVLAYVSADELQTIGRDRSGTVSGSSRRGAVGCETEVQPWGMEDCTICRQL